MTRTEKIATLGVIALLGLCITLAATSGCTVAEPMNSGYLARDPVCISVVKTKCTGGNCYVSASNGNIYRVHPVRVDDFEPGQSYYVKVEMYDLVVLPYGRGCTP